MVDGVRKLIEWLESGFASEENIIDSYNSGYSDTKQIIVSSPWCPRPVLAADAVHGRYRGRRWYEKTLAKRLGQEWVIQVWTRRPHRVQPYSLGYKVVWRRGCYYPGWLRHLLLNRRTSIVELQSRRAFGQRGDARGQTDGFVR